MHGTQLRSRKSAATANGRKARAVLAMVLADLDRARRDGGISLRQLAAASAVSESHLSQLFAGEREPSVSVLTAIARALGGNLSIKFYPGIGPAIHDRIQAPIAEELLRIAAPSWSRYVEVPVVHPARGFIDVVFDSMPLATTVATEVESRIDRLEQQIRWAQEKAASLPSSDLWSQTNGDRTIYRLLVLRSTAMTREIARRFDNVLRAAYPAKSADVFAALATPATAWPGDGILWAEAHGDDVRILNRPPRGIDVGR